MRALLMSLPLLVLAACGQPPAPEPASTASAAPAPAGAPITTGQMGGMSTSASGDVALVTIGADEIAFADGDGEDTFAPATEYLGALPPETLIAENGESFAAAAPSNAATRIELRRIVGEPSERLCGGLPATHVALVITDPLTVLQLMAFSGVDAPGPDAHDSAICAIYAYAVD